MDSDEKQLREVESAITYWWSKQTEVNDNPLFDYVVGILEERRDQILRRIAKLEYPGTGEEVNSPVEES
jgi:hypothetical protein